MITAVAPKRRRGRRDADDPRPQLPRRAQQEHRGLQARGRPRGVRQGGRRHEEDAAGRRCPATLQKFFALKAGTPVPTRFRLRVLAAQFGKSFTATQALADRLGPRAAVSHESRPTATDGDGDKATASTNTLRRATTTTTCSRGRCTRGSRPSAPMPCRRATRRRRRRGRLRVPVGASTSTTTSTRTRTTMLPYPGKRPYPNPLFADATIDYDGDSLTLASEHDLWRYTLRRQPHGDAHADAAELLRRRAVLALHLRERRPRRPAQPDAAGVRATDPKQHARSSPGPRAHGYAQGAALAAPARRRARSATIN